jgi:uncharacterized integral membrane protein
MSADKHDVESQGAKPRDHDHPRQHFLRHAHRDWRVWIVAVVLIALIFVYLLTNDLSVRPSKTAQQPATAVNVP